MPAKLFLTSGRILTPIAARRLSRHISNVISQSSQRTAAREPKSPRSNRRKASKRDQSKGVIGHNPPVQLPDEDCLLRIRLPIRLTNANGGRSRHYGASHSFRREIELQLRAWSLTRRPFQMPVMVHVIRVLGPRERMWDSSSILRGNWKEIEDALVAVGWFQDDGPNWITRTTAAQATDRNEGPSLIIEVSAHREG